MFSVTERVKQVPQPRGGYVSPKLIIEKNYEDGKSIEEFSVSFYDSVQGMVVDYLTRVVCGTPKHIAFAVSLKGAAEIGESDKAKELLKKINGLDRQSIICACELVCYDVYIRKENYCIINHGITVYEEMINNITIMVKRSVLFFERNGPVVLDGFTFSGAYNDVISSGDGDFLTKDTLWDFKTIKKRPDKNHTLQLLVYYILGLHSVHSEFIEIKRLGIFNPKLNSSYEIYICDIDDEVFKKVSRDVIGYITPDDATLWRNANGTSEDALKEIENILVNQCVDTAFSPSNYGDGIYDITIDDYWTYCRNLYGGNRPKYSDIDTIKLLKNSSFFMFVATSKKGELKLMQKGKRRNLDKPLEYYYNYLPIYGNAVLNIFFDYWSALYKISEFIRSINFDEQDLKNYCRYWIKDKTKSEKVFKELQFRKMTSHDFYGSVHGCIVDIDFNNHIFVNPNDGSIIPYFSTSKDEMPRIYESLEDLIAKRRPEMFPSFLRSIDEYGDREVAFLLSGEYEKGLPAKITDEAIISVNNYCDDEDEIVAKKIMYSYSRKIEELQAVYNHHFVQVWYDDFLLFNNDQIKNYLWEKS